MRHLTGVDSPIGLIVSSEGGALSPDRRSDIKPPRNRGPVGLAFLKDSQFAFGNLELRETALQADCEFGKYPHDWHFQSLESEKMKSDFRTEDALLIGWTRFAGHEDSTSCKSPFSANLDAMQCRRRSQPELRS